MISGRANGKGLGLIQYKCNVLIISSQYLEYLIQCDCYTVLVKA